ncbi:aldehyde dehydrogenase family protein [Oceanobacillus sp. J11TS1]|uniref:aldehyde dehydrogenase family protein n=1 Tax=Oceanobacillus sp. J11TS1 TaxID=2807191 RepID=UPI001B11A029|nr:aldehyde dehydrogenase family protein [Oceanobacillus sp. J11TS1]GIO24069.1 aldehyde dehydrogenase [Oceanobacillus sp. J11TS1]
MPTIIKQTSMTINGEKVNTEKTLPVINPAKETEVGVSPVASRDDLNKVVFAARTAFPKWAALSMEKRAEMLEKLADVIAKNREELARIFTLEMGRPINAAFGSYTEIDHAASWCRAVSNYRVPREVIEDTEKHRVERIRTPLGVAGLIVPWNFPVMLAMWKISSALLSGNTIVVKPSPYTPLTTLRIGEIAREIFPRGVFNVVAGTNELGQWMTEHPDIDKISFTGSTATGKKVMKSAANNLKRVSLELGGNDAAIVLEDADPKEIVEPLFWSAFSNTAQVCVATKRLYVHEKIYDEFLDSFVQYAKKIPVGDGMEPTTMIGPVQNKMQYEKVKDLINDAKRTGANIVCGGNVEDKTGYFIPITIIDNPPENSRVVTEEAFGPVLPVIKYSDYEEVIKKANDTSYGLAGTVWGRDLELARTVAEKLETGTVWINEFQVMGPQYPFGGHKQSGVGVENSLDGILEYTNSKVIMLKKK